jgi:glutamate transport system substrate-binding protein
VKAPRWTAALLMTLILATACASPENTLRAAPVEASPVPQTTYFQDPVTIGVEYDQPALSVDKDGRFAGFDIDLARYIAAGLKFAPNSFTQINDLNRAESLGGTVKLVIATYSITSGRELGTDGDPAVDFVGPYMITPDALLVKKHSKYATPDPRLNGARVCTLDKSTTDSAAAPLPKGVIPVTSAENYSQCVHDVETGSADAVLTDALILHGYAADTRQYPGLVVEKTQWGGLNQYGIALPHGRVAACEKLIPVVQSFINSGAWKSYFEEDFPRLTQSDPSWQQDYQPDVNTIRRDSYCR